MQREEKSERSRRLVLDAALKLFSRQGFRGTSVRDIAETAGVSTGNLYHHFPDKETIFRTLLDEYRSATNTDEFPFYRVMRTGRFPDNLEELGYAARDSVRKYRPYLALIYVDVIEFSGTHIREFYTDMAQRFSRWVEEQRTGDDVTARLRPGVSVLSALLTTTRIYFNYFQLEILFGVSEPFGKDTAQVIREIADILRNGFAAEELVRR